MKKTKLLLQEILIAKQFHFFGLDDREGGMGQQKHHCFHH
jgi:hypothetical protein